MTKAALRRHLRDLRKRRGRFASTAAAESEVAGLLARLRHDSLERRVFEMCEILEIPFKVVAGALGISERHLYRLRAGMSEQLDAAVGSTVVSDACIPELQQIEFARALLKYGHAQRALEVSERLLISTMPVTHMIQALTVRAMAMSDQELYEEACSVLDDAQRQVTRLDDYEAAHAARAIAMVYAYIAYRDGDSRRAIELSESALGAPEKLNNPFDARSYARDLIFLGVQHEEAGSPQRSLECLHKARELLSRLREPPAAELARVHIHIAFVRSGLPEYALHAQNDAKEALEISQWHGLGYEEIWANLALAILSDMAGNPHDGLSFAQHALQLATSMCDGDPLARTLIIVGRLEGACGHGERALERFEAARGLVENHGLLRGILEVARARIASAQ